MKIVHPIFDEKIILDEYGINCLIIENGNDYYEIVSDILNQINNNEEGFFYAINDNDETLDLHKDAFIITDPFLFSLQNREIKNTIIKDIVKISQRDESDEFTKIKQDIQNYIQKLILQYDVPLIFDDEIEISQLLKLVNVIPHDEEEDKIKRMINWLVIINDVLHPQIIFTINIFSILSKKESETLTSEIIKTGILVVNIQNKISYNSKFIKTHIDEDSIQLFIH
ncbi:MAG: type II-A CRISPR-associated protein Csn2 [Bacteroidales bacterium]|nr:type II-A CRISPR-associated protein Csn2 [Bacteroidales bacterium]